MIAKESIAIGVWELAFDREEMVKDFAGRTMVKSAYNDEYAQYGWTITHIAPMNEYGNLTQSNLICCNIKTANEKSFNFPVFRANGEVFEVIVDDKNKPKIRKREEIYTKDRDEELKEVCFFEGKSGVKYFRELKKKQTGPQFVGTILIRISGLKNTSIVDFIEKFFETENITYSIDDNFSDKEARVVAKNYNLPMQEDSQLLLNKCMVMNTYLQRYFMPRGDIDSYEMYYRLDFYPEKSLMYLQSQTLTADNFNVVESKDGKFQNCLLLSQNVVHNTNVSEKVKAITDREYVPYAGIFTHLAAELDKVVKREQKKK